MLIPPSIILVLNGVLTEQFDKTPFVAALIPGRLAHVAAFNARLARQLFRIVTPSRFTN